MWEGGDTGVDRPHIILERKNGEEWEEVTTEEGMPVDERRGDILLSYTPSPLYPLSAEQSTYYWIGWQAVGTNTDRMGFPEGTYRFHIYGKSYVGNNTTWPWDTEDYELTSPEFVVAPAELNISVEENQVLVSLVGHPQGFRLVSMEGSSQGSNPPIQSTLTLTHSDGSVTEIDQDPVIENGYLRYTDLDLSDTIRIDSVDIYENEGVWEYEGDSEE